MGQAPSADSLGQLTLRIELEAVDLGQYQWMLNTAKGHQESNLQMGFNSHRQAFDNYRHSYELKTVRMTSCIGYLTNLARYLGVAPSKLTQEVQNLKQQNDQYQREAEEGQQARALREQVDKLEARNEEMEGILESMGEGLQQQTSCWATA
jgi:cell division protein FtsB